MNFYLLSSLLLVSLYLSPAFSPTFCFENQKVKMREIIDLEENNHAKPLSEKLSKLASVKNEAVKVTTVKGYAMNGGAREDISVHYYKNAAAEDVASYNYGGSKYYRVRNLTSECTALFVSYPESKKVLLLASLPADRNDSFYNAGVVVNGYKDADLEGIEGKSSTECRVVNDGVNLYSVISRSCGKIKFCRLEAICKGKDEIIKAFCRSEDDKCPKFEDCMNDKSFEKMSTDFQEGTIHRESQKAKASGQ